MPHASYKNIKGQRFGRLTTLRISPKRKFKAVAWVCKCDCGNIHVTSGTWLRDGSVKSCGCLALEANTTHGGSRLSTNVVSPLYTKWVDIRLRCYSKKSKGYKNYGGRGIKMHTAWRHNFLKFQAYVLLNLGPPRKGLTLDRINSEKNYTPGNLRWATYRTQNVNKSKSRHLKTSSKYKGVSYCKKLNKWVARTSFNNKSIYIGIFTNEKSAASAYNKVVKLYHGTDAVLNQVAK